MKFVFKTNDIVKAEATLKALKQFKKKQAATAKDGGEPTGGGG